MRRIARFDNRKEGESCAGRQSKYDECPLKGQRLEFVT